MDLGVLNHDVSEQENTPELTPEIRGKLMEIQDECFSHFARLVKSFGIAERIFTEEEVSQIIETHLDDNGEEIKEHLGKNGQVFVAMNSAEQVADSITHYLGITNPIHKIKISTYIDAVSSGEDISQSTKDEILNSMNLSPGDCVLIIEDMIDTGNTLDRLVTFFESLGVKVKILCLFDKQMEKNAKNKKEREKTKAIKERLGDRLQCIKKVGPDFLIGSGIDYSRRLLAELLGLYKIHPQYIDFFIEEMAPYIKRIDAILRTE